MKNDNWAEKLAKHYFLHKDCIHLYSDRKDRSLRKLEELLNDGYVMVKWLKSNRPCIVCQDLSGGSWQLEDFLEETTHEAPIFSHSHPGCNCSLLLQGKNLPNVIVSTY